MISKKFKRPGIGVIKRYDNGGVTLETEPTDPPKKGPVVIPEEEFNRRVIMAKSGEARRFLEEFYSQPEVRNKLAQSLAFVPDGEGPPRPAEMTKAYQALAKMYPNRVEEMATYDGLASVMADHMGDFMGSMGNMKFEDTDQQTSGSVVRSSGDVRSGMGTSQRPFTMGMRPIQERMNIGVQVDPWATTPTYIHEMTHATDIHDNPYAKDYLNRRRKRLSMSQDPDEFISNYEALAEAGEKIGLEAPDFLAYVGDPGETLARLNEIRYEGVMNLMHPMNYEYAVDDIPSIESTKAFRELAAVYGAENVIEMLNEIF